MQQSAKPSIFNILFHNFDIIIWCDTRMIYVSHIIVIWSQLFVKGTKRLKKVKRDWTVRIRRSEESVKFHMLLTTQGQ